MANFIYDQRIYDTGVGGWVYYSKVAIDPTPLAGETTPNHTNNLVAGTHEVLTTRLDLTEVPSAADPIWEWNGVDATQFEGSPAHQSGGSIANATLTVVPAAGAPSGNVLRFTTTGLGTGWAHILAVDPLPLVLDEPRSFRWEFLLWQRPAYGGLAFLGDNVGAYHAWAWSWASNAGWRHRIDADVAFQVVGSSTNNALTAGTFGPSLVKINAKLHKPSGAPPEFHISGVGLFINGGDWSGMYHSGTGNVDSNFQTAAGDEPASWDNLACDRWGLQLQASGGGSAGPMDFASIRVFDEGAL